jgi:methylenetetrahydrofolate reductase (NADPH)
MPSAGCSPTSRTIRMTSRTTTRDGDRLTKAAPSISIELVPRDLESIAAELEIIREHLPTASAVNIPDLLRFETRSWDACASVLASDVVQRAIPHVRAMDFRVRDAFSLAERLRERGLREVLIVRGDAPQDMRRPIYPTSSAELIREVKRLDPELRIYAAFDPYRHGLRTELEGVAEKIDAGAEGFFSQPLFDLRLIEMCAEQLGQHPNIQMYWGLAPVVRESSRRYWEVKNRAIFPSDFEPTLDWNRTFAKECLNWAEQSGDSLYFMPIRVDLAAYLQGIL